MHLEPAIGIWLGEYAWQSLNKQVASHATFRRFFATRSDWARRVLAAPLKLCDGLIEALEDVQPPGLAFFTSLPAPKFGQWGVYVLVFQNTDQTEFAIYIGSGTNIGLGVGNRQQQYENGKKLPEEVQKLIDEGWEFIHMGMLIWAEQPKWEYLKQTTTLENGLEVNVASFLPRAVFLVLESTLTSALGAMCSRERTEFRWTLWDPEDYWYRGLCTHDCLIEEVKWLSPGAIFANKHYSKESKWFRQQVVYDQQAWQRCFDRLQATV